MPITIVPPATTLPGKFPFWSTIIAQQHGTLDLAIHAWTYLDIQPPPGETWWVFINATSDCYESDSVLSYYDYDGTTARLHIWYKKPYYENYGYSLYMSLQAAAILADTLWARIGFYNGHGATRTGYYGYSGFELSRPLLSLKRWSKHRPFKKKTSLRLPKVIEKLDRYKAEILGLDPRKPNEYVLGVVLEEDTPLAHDPRTGLPVERVSVYVRADVLADLVTKFRKGELDPDKTGYRKYIEKWRDEGIDLGL